LANPKTPSKGGGNNASVGQGKALTYRGAARPRNSPRRKTNVKTVRVSPVRWKEERQKGRNQAENPLLRGTSPKAGRDINVSTKKKKTIDEKAEQERSCKEKYLRTARQKGGAKTLN